MPPTPAPTAQTAATAPPAPRPKRGGLVAQVQAHLQAQMQTGQLQEGDQLPTESAIMDALGVSRTVVREAISRLQAAGQVQTRHGIGTFVLAALAAPNLRITAQDMATVDDVIAVLELRISLETEAAALAAQRATPEQRQAVAHALAQLARATADQTDPVQGDFQFHLLVAQASGNRHFAELLQHLGAHIIPRTRLPSAGAPADGQMAYLQRVHTEHTAIYQAIASGNAAAARAAMRAHLSNSLTRLRKARDGLNPTPKPTPTTTP